MFRGSRLFSGGARAGFRSFGNYSARYSVPLLSALCMMQYKACMLEVERT